MGCCMAAWPSCLAQPRACARDSGGQGLLQSCTVGAYSSTSRQECPAGPAALAGLAHKLSPPAPRNTPYRVRHMVRPPCRAPIGDRH